LAAENSTLTNTELDELNTKEALWTAKSKTAVREMYNWINVAEAYSSAIGTN
jgi:hypothetical protein